MFRPLRPAGHIICEANITPAGRISFRKAEHIVEKSTALAVLFLVEMGGIEPPSESASSGTSPGADGYLRSLVRAQAVMLADSVAS